jgi:hypothetical protein
MSELIVPTDAASRRKLEELAMSRGLPSIPEDSVLRRHYLQRLEVLLDMPAATPATSHADASARPVSRPSRETVGAGAPAAQPTSWFGRLLRKLSGG